MSRSKPVKLKLFIYVTLVTQMNTPPRGHRPYKLVPPLNTRILHKAWTTDEIQLTLSYAKNKRSPEDIAKKLGRPVSEVRSKLKAIAAEMYLLKKVPYDQIHEATGVEKNTFIISSSTYRHNGLDVSSDMDDDIEANGINSSIYEFDTSVSEVDTMINVKIQDDIDEMTVTVSVESPFSVKSICEHLSTPILSTFSTCSRFAKKISGIQHETLFVTNQTPH